MACFNSFDMSEAASFNSASAHQQLLYLYPIELLRVLSYRCVTLLPDGLHDGRYVLFQSSGIKCESGLLMISAQSLREGY